MCTDYDILTKLSIAIVATMPAKPSRDPSQGDIGMEKQVEQEAAYPIPISLCNCYRTVRHEKRGRAITPDSVSHASLSCNSCTKI